MAEIASFGVDVDENTKLAQNAQDTADEAGTGIGDLNDPNKLAPAEKAALKQKYDTDVLLYGMDKQKLTSSQLSTAELDNAMNALTAYMTPFFANMTSTDTVDRDTLNTVYKNFDTADKNADSAFTNMVSSAASGAMVAGSQASVAGSEAVVAGNQASQAASNAAVQASVAVSNANVAQSSVVAAIAKAGFASDTALAASQAATSAALTANAAAAGVIDAKNDAANALSNAATAFNVANGARDSAASAINSAANALDKVNGMQFGGRNYALNTGTPYTRLAGTGWGNLFLATLSKNLNGENVVVSFDLTVDGVSDTGVAYIQFGDDMVPAWYAGTSNNNQIAGISQSNWQIKLNTLKPGVTTRFSYAFKMPVWADSTKTDIANISIASSDTMGANVTISRVKVELGNVATDYSQAPEDIQQQFTDIDGQLESKVSKDTYDVLADTVSQTSTLAQQNQNALVSKADSSDVNVLKQRVTTAENTLTQTATETELQQTKTDVDNINKSVETNTSNITAQAGKIDGLLNTTKNVGDQLTTLQGNFNLNSQQWETNFSKAQTNIGNLSHSFNSDTSTAGYTSGSDGSFTTYAPNGERRTDYIPIDPTKQYYLKVVATVSPSGANWLGMTFYDKDKKFISRIDGYAPAVTGNVHQTSLIAYNYTDSAAIRNATIPSNAVYAVMQARLYSDGVASWSENLATVTALTQVKQTAEGAQALATNNQGDITNLQATAKGLQTSVSNAATKDQLNILSDTFSNEISSATSAANSKMIQTINHAGIGFTNPDGSKFQMSLSADGVALMDFSKIMLNGATNIANGTIGNAQIADAAITNAKIGKLAVGTAQIADLAVTSAKVSELDASLIKSGTIDTNRLNADAIITDVINGKTITGIDIVGSTITGGNISLGGNGHLTTTFDVLDQGSLNIYKPWHLKQGKMDMGNGYLTSSAMGMKSRDEADLPALSPNATFDNTAQNLTGTLNTAYLKFSSTTQDNQTHQRSYLDATQLTFGDNSNGTDAATLDSTQISVPWGSFSSLVGTPVVSNEDGGTLELNGGKDDTGANAYLGSWGGKPTFRSEATYAHTVSYSPNVYVTTDGGIERSTSASKYKLDITKNDEQLNDGFKLLTLDSKYWFDKGDTEDRAEEYNSGADNEANPMVKPHYGLIAEDLRDAGLDKFISYGPDGIEGLQYDRLWTVLIPVMRNMNDRINKQELEISKLEGAN